MNTLELTEKGNFVIGLNEVVINIQFSQNLTKIYDF